MARKRKSQVWSLDSLLATVVFIAAIAAFLIIVSFNSSKSAEELKAEAENVPRMLLDTSDSGVYIVEDNEVDVDKLKVLKDYDYDALREKLGLTGDFCIFFEDEEGNIIDVSRLIGDGSGVGIGSADINVSQDVSCVNP